MNYIYDIVLNFQKNYYNFFEWKRTDNIKNIYKISLYHVSNNDFLNLKYNKVQVSDKFINKIKQDNPKFKKIICLISNTKTSIGLMFDEKGNLEKRSSLLFEEETEVNKLAKNLPITNIEIIKKIEVSPQNLLRIEIEKKELLKNYLNKLTDESTLKYLYYTYFKTEEINPQKIKTKLINEIDKEWNTKKNNLYKTISLLMKYKLPSK